MRQQLIPMDDDAPARPNVPWDKDDKAPWNFPVEMMKMQSILWDNHAKRWDVRARGCQHFASDPDIEVAMRRALDLLKDPPLTRRKLL